MAFRKLDDGISVSPQISVDDVAEAAGAGFALIINNRPDGESPDEPQGDEIEAAAQAQGMGYCAIPIGHSGFSQPQVDMMVEQLQRAGGPVLAYCRSGTRSTLLWSLARAKLGDAPEDLNAKANAAGYDLTPVATLIDMLAKRR
jgi:uncharacterized protein (TIGR01244 family)